MNKIPQNLYFTDGYGEITVWWRDEEEGGFNFSPAEHLPAEFYLDAPEGWWIFDGTVRRLTEEDLTGDPEAPDAAPWLHHHINFQPGDEWWSGNLVPATPAQVVLFFRLHPMTHTFWCEDEDADHEHQVPLCCHPDCRACHNEAMMSMTTRPDPGVHG